MDVPIQTAEADVLVIGAGGAGCMAAMAAADAGASVLLLEKGRLGLSGSTFDPFTADKGITVAAPGFNPTDDPEVHYREAMAAGRGLADPALVRIAAYEAPQRFAELLAAGVPFLPNRLEACFGKALLGAFVPQRALAVWFCDQMFSRPIRVLEHTMAFELLVNSAGECAGAAAVDRRGRFWVLHAGAVVLATGGASQIFRYNFNTPSLTGDGLVLALGAGAKLANLEFYQAILGITSPVRVFFPQWYLAGAPVLRNAEGAAFLQSYLPPGERAADLLVDRSTHGPFSASRTTRWVDLAIWAELQAGRGRVARDGRLAGVECDFAGLSPARRLALDARSARPALAWLAARRARVETRPAPLAPFAHAFNGGVIIDEHGATGASGLYACGEVAAGPHGANRVGGHMFAVLLAFGHRAGRAAAAARAIAGAGHAHTAPGRADINKVALQIARLREADGVLSPADLRAAVQDAMSPVMLAKDADSLQAALSQLEGVRAKLDRLSVNRPRDLIDALGVENLTAVAELVARSALLRRETRGPHYRSDAPAEGGEAWARRIIWRVETGQPEPGRMMQSLPAVGRLEEREDKKDA